MKYGAEIENEWSYASTPSICLCVMDTVNFTVMFYVSTLPCIFMVWCLIKQRDIFVFSSINDVKLLQAKHFNQTEMCIFHN